MMIFMYLINKNYCSRESVAKITFENNRTCDSGEDVLAKTVTKSKNEP